MQKNNLRNEISRPFDIRININLKKYEIHVTGNLKSLRIQENIGKIDMVGITPKQVRRQLLLGVAKIPPQFVRRKIPPGFRSHITC